MTVAAAIFAAQPASALADVDGVPAARHLARLARDAGASPVLVVSFDPDGSVAAAIDGTAALVAPAPVERGPVGQLGHGVDRAVETEPGTTAVLLWPARSTDVAPATVAALIAAHAVDPSVVIRPSTDPASAFPALFPVVHRAALDAVAADRMPGDAIADVVAGGVVQRLLARDADPA